MNVRAIAVAVSACCAAGSASAAFIAVDYGSYTVVYDDSTGFGAPTFNGESGSSKSFGWSIPSSFNSVNPAGPVFNLPQFLIKANTGFALNGPVELFVGNFVFSETNSPSSVATTSALLTGWAVKDEDYGAAALVLKDLDRTVIASADPLTIGTYSGTTTAAAGSFSNLGFWNGQLTFSAAGGYSAAVVSQEQNLFKVSLVSAAVVPEPATVSLMLVGGLAIGALARRRRTAP
ncbi:PEP-CTERM sorting domain-containing protein [Roseateles sp. P5_E7]